MSGSAAWFGDRRPAPPEDLAAAVHVYVDAEEPLDVALTAGALERLSEARARPGRVRESAFRLLEADAMLTYACEAALERPDPEAALRRILAAAGR